MPVTTARQCAACGCEIDGLPFGDIRNEVCMSCHLDPNATVRDEDEEQWAYIAAEVEQTRSTTVYFKVRADDPRFKAWLARDGDTAELLKTHREVEYVLSEFLDDAVTDTISSYDWVVDGNELTGIFVAKDGYKYGSFEVDPEDEQ